MRKSSFTFSEASDSAEGNGLLTVSNERIAGVDFQSQGGNPRLVLESESMKNIQYVASTNSKDVITLQENTMLRKASKFNLNDKADIITFHGEMQKTYVDLGDDKTTDQVNLDSLDQIVKKKLIITNFDREDVISIGGQTYTQDDLKEVDFDPIKIISPEGDILA